MAKTRSAGVKVYRETFSMPDHAPQGTGILACAKITSRPGVPRPDMRVVLDAAVTTRCCLLTQRGDRNRRLWSAHG
jgi:hypothetical protein